MFLAFCSLPPLTLATAPYLNSTYNFHVLNHPTIEQTLAKWPVAVDSKNYSLLSEVFTLNATLDAQLPTGPLTGIAAIQDFINQTFGDIPTQHDIGTQHIGVWNHTAYATTYFVATLYNLGTKNGSVNHAKYLDTMVKSGEDGDWRISNKTLIYLIPGQGNITLV